MENTHAILNSKTFIYVKSWVYFESMLPLDEVNAILKTTSDVALVKIPCVLTIRVMNDQVRKVKDYYLDPKEILAIIDNDSDLTAQYETKPEIIDEAKEKQEVQDELEKEVKKGK